MVKEYMFNIIIWSEDIFVPILSNVSLHCSMANNKSYAIVSHPTKILL